MEEGREVCESDAESCHGKRQGLCGRNSAMPAEFTVLKCILCEGEAGNSVADLLMLLRLSVTS
jgi:hypothetical protein